MAGAVTPPHPYGLLAPAVEKAVHDYAGAWGAEGGVSFATVAEAIKLEAQDHGWNHYAAASWCCYMLVLVGALKKSKNGEYLPALDAPTGCCWDGLSDKVRRGTGRSEVTASEGERENERGYLQAGVLVACEESGVEEWVWGTSERSIYRGYKLVCEGCSCPRGHFLSQ